MSTYNKPTVSQLEQAIEITKKIEALEAQLAAIWGGAPAPVKVGAKRGRKPKAVVEAAAEVEAPKRGRKKGKRVLSPEARERIAEAQRRRWADSKK